MTEVEQSAAPQNGIDLSAAEDDDNSKARPADIEQDMREMERRKRVEAIMGSKLFREELERIVDSAREGGTTSGILQQLSDIVGIPCTRVGSVFKASNCMMPINDIRGVESMGYAKGEKILRCKLAATFRLLDLYGWTQGLGAQITARLKVDQEYFLVNPYGMMYHEITASSLNKVDMQGQIVEQGTTNFGVNKSHFVLHSVVHAARPDIRCAIYIGCSPVVAVSSLKSGILPLTKDACVLGEITTHAYTGSLDGEERDKLVRSLGPNSKVMLLSNHGALCCGETIEEAFHSACHIVQACETQLKLLPVGLDNLVLIPEESRKQIYEQSRRPPEDLEKKFAAAVSTQQSTDEQATEQKEEHVTAIKATGNIPKWRVGGAEFEALMRMLDNAGYRTGYIYRHPLVKSDPPKPKNDVELPPAVSSLGYLLEEEELFKQGIWKKGELRKGGDRSRWLNSPNVYQKVEVLETGTPDPKKITKWVAEGSPTHSTPVRIEDPLQFVPAGTNPKEFKRVQQQIKDNRRADKISAGPQSHILEGVTWDEANRIKDATVSQAGDHVVLVGAASKGIIQRGFQHNATVYKAPYAKNPFDNVTDDELNEYKRTVERKKKSIHGEYTDTDFSESEALSSQQTSGAQHTKQTTTTTTTAQAVSQSEPEDISEHQVMRIETQQAPVPSQPEVVLSDEQNKNFNFKQVSRASQAISANTFTVEAYKSSVVGADAVKAHANDDVTEADANKENIYKYNQNMQNPYTPDKMQGMRDKLHMSANSNNTTTMTTTPASMWHSMRSSSSNNDHAYSPAAATTTTTAAFTNNMVANNNLNCNSCAATHGCIGVGNIVAGNAYGMPYQGLIPANNADASMQTFQPHLLSGSDDLTSTRYFMASASPPSLTQSCNNIFQYTYPSVVANMRPVVCQAAAPTQPAALAYAAQRNDFVPPTTFDCAANAGAAASDARAQQPCQNYRSAPVIPENAYKKSIFCRTPQLCDYIFDALQHRSSSSEDGNSLINNIPFRIEGGSGPGQTRSVSMPVTPTAGNSPHKSRCGTPHSKRRPMSAACNSPYRTVSHFGFNSPQRAPQPEHKHIPNEPKKYVALRRSVSYEEIFSSPRYMDLCENCFERLVRIKPELLQMRARLRNIYDLVQPCALSDANVPLQRVDAHWPAESKALQQEPYAPAELELYTTALTEFEQPDDDMSSGPVPAFNLQLPPVLEEEELFDVATTARSGTSVAAAAAAAAAANAPNTNTTFIEKILGMNYSNESTNINYGATTPHTISSNITLELLDGTQYQHTGQRALSPRAQSPQQSGHSLHAVRECTNFVREQQQQIQQNSSAERSLSSSPTTISLNALTELEIQLLSAQPYVTSAEIIDYGNWPTGMHAVDEAAAHNVMAVNEAEREQNAQRKLDFNDGWERQMEIADKQMQMQMNLEDMEAHIILSSPLEEEEVFEEEEAEGEQLMLYDTQSLNNGSIDSTTSETYYNQTLVQRQQLFKELPGLVSYPSIEAELDSLSSQHSLSFINSAIRNQLDGIDALLRQSISSSDSYEESEGEEETTDYVFHRRNISSGYLNVILEESEEDEEQEESAQLPKEQANAASEADQRVGQANEATPQATAHVSNRSSEALQDSAADLEDKSLDANRKMCIYEAMERRLADIETASLKNTAALNYAMLEAAANVVDGVERFLEEGSEENNVDETDEEESSDGIEEADDGNYALEECAQNVENENQNYGHNERANKATCEMENVAKPMECKTSIMLQMEDTEEQRQIDENFANAINALEAEDYAPSDNDEESKASPEQAAEDAIHELLSAEEDSTAELPLKSSDESLSQEDYEDNDDDDDADVDAPLFEDDDMLDIRLRHRVLKRKCCKHQPQLNANDTDDTDNANVGVRHESGKAHAYCKAPFNTSSDADDERCDDANVHSAPVPAPMPAKASASAKSTHYVNEQSITYVNLLQHRHLHSDDALDITSLFEHDDSSIDTTTSQQRYVDSDVILTAASSPCQRLANEINAALSFDVGAPRRVNAHERLAGGCEVPSTKAELIQLTQQIAHNAHQVARRVHEHLATACESADCHSEDTEQLLCHSDTPSNDGSGDGIPIRTKEEETFFRDLSLEAAKNDEAAAAFTLCRTDGQSVRFFGATAQSEHGVTTEEEVFSMHYVYDNMTQQAELKFMEYLPALNAGNQKSDIAINSDELLTYNIPLVAEQFELYAQAPQQLVTSEDCVPEQETFEHTIVAASSPLQQTPTRTVDEHFEFYAQAHTTAAADVEECFDNTIVSLASASDKPGSSTRQSAEREEFENTSVCVSSPTRNSYTSGPQTSSLASLSCEQFENTSVSVSSPTHNSSTGSPLTASCSSPAHEQFEHTSVVLSSPPRHAAEREDFYNTTVSLTTTAASTSPEREHFDNTTVALSSATAPLSPKREDFCNTMTTITSPSRQTATSSEHFDNTSAADSLSPTREFFDNTLLTVTPPTDAATADSNNYLTPLERQILSKIEQNGLAEENEIFKKIELTIRNKLTPSKLDELVRQSCRSDTSSVASSYATPKRLPRKQPEKPTEKPTETQRHNAKRNRIQNKAPQKQSHTNNKRARSPLRTSRAINITVSNSTHALECVSPGGNSAKKRNFIRENIRNAGQQHRQAQLKRLQKPSAAAADDIRKRNINSSRGESDSADSDVFSFQSKVVRGSPSFWVSLPKSPARSPRCNGTLVRTHRKPAVANSEIKQERETPQQLPAAEKLDTSDESAAELAVRATDSSLTLVGEPMSAADVIAPMTHVDSEIAALGAQLSALQPRLETYKHQIDSYGETIADCAQCLDDCIDLQHNIAQQHHAMCHEMRLQQYAADINCQVQTYAIDAADD